MQIANIMACNPRRAIILAEATYQMSAVLGEEFNLKAILHNTLALGFDLRGLDDRHRAYLDLLKFTNKPVGLRTISSSLQCSTQAVRELEADLLKRKLVEITPRGRLLV